jgi:hypothetical protein
MLVISAAALFAWGLVRALGRGDPAAFAWPSLAMAAMVILAAVNVALRSRLIATAVLTLSAFLAASVLAATFAEAERSIQEYGPVLRALLFLIVLGLASWRQRRAVTAGP